MEGLCTLQYAVSRVEDCPGSRCPFWLVEDGQAGCVLGGIEAEIAARPSVAHYLLKLRLDLDRARVAQREPAPRSLFYRLLDEEQAAEA
jgi:hypothetical protein